MAVLTGNSSENWSEYTFMRGGVFYTLSRYADNKIALIVSGGVEYVPAHAV